MLFLIQLPNVSRKESIRSWIKFLGHYNAYKRSSRASGSWLQLRPVMAFVVIWRVNQWKILSFSLSPFCPPALQSLKWLLKRGTFIDLVPMCQALIHSVSCKPPCNSVRKAGVGQNPWLKVWEQRLGIAVKMHFGKPASHSVVPEREPQLCSQYHLPANAHPEGHKVKSQVLETQHPCSPVFSLGV